MSTLDTTHVQASVCLRGAVASLAEVSAVVAKAGLAFNGPSLGFALTPLTPSVGSSADSGECLSAVRLSLRAMRSARRALAAAAASGAAGRQDSRA